MKKLFVFLLLMTYPILLFSQIIENEGVQSMNYWEISWKLGQYVLLGMLSTASSHIAALTFSFKLWIKDTFLPGLYAYVASMAIAFIDIYVKHIDFFVEQVIGQTDSQNITKLAVLGIVLVGLIKGYIKRAKTKEKVAKAKLAGKNLTK